MSSNKNKNKNKKAVCRQTMGAFLLPPMQPVSEHPIVDYSLKLGYTEELLRKLEVALLNKSKGEAVTA
ncbi:hypothetical protein A0H81_02018 [Grifola frondosa]|uniref:Uncharacterized protein n=1 Tax=Grifola frondosa TaxID=5627 RepID=A0A1C7MLP9_GRIFR|nr:hypothetical protein A0H81_02018 [Grifola frondosa]